jgi:type I restriction enzyme S subunit
MNHRNIDMEIPEGFKMTELGQLPKDWEIKCLEKLNLEKKVNLNPANFPNEVFEYYSIPAYQEFKKPILEKGSAILSQKAVLKNGCVLFGKLNPRVEKVWKVQSDSEYRKIGSSEWMLIFPDNSKVDSDYLYYVEWSKYVMPVAKTLVTGSTPSRQRVDPTSFYKIKIPLPPLPEQKKIAAVLSVVQEAKEKTEEVIKATKELKKSLMKHLFTYGPVPVEKAEKVKLKETEIGMVPEEWEVRPLIDIATLQRGKDLPRQEQISGPYPIVGSSGIIGYHNEYVCNGPGVVTGRSGSIGKLTYVEKDYWPHNTGLYVKDFHENNPKFIYHVLHLLDFKKYATGVSVPTLNRNFIHSALLPLPPHPIQEKIVEILTSIQDKIEVEENKKKALEELFKTLLNQLMTGKIRVNDLEIRV